jgi:hypothetical protein
MAAIDTLAPGSCPDTSNPKSKLETLAAVIGVLADADHEILAHLADMSPSTNAGRGGPDSSARNRASISGKVNSAAKESVKEMLNSTNTDLSEEFKERVAELFETALDARVNVERICLEEAALITYQELTDRIDAGIAELNERINEGEYEVEDEQVTEETTNGGAKPGSLMEAYCQVISRQRPR